MTDPAACDSAVLEPVALATIARAPFATAVGPEARTVRQLLERQAARRGPSEALLALDRPPLRFADLAALVESRRRDLLELGLGRGDRVALVSSRHAEGMTAFLTIASLTACAPLRPLASRDELAFGLKDLRATAVVVEKDLPTPAREVAATLDLPVVDLVAREVGEVGLFELAGRPWGPPRRDEEPDEDEVALLLHTTGSTARAKLVPFTQSRLAHTAWGTATALGLDARDRCLSFMPLFHVHGLVSGVLVPLMAGGSVASLGEFRGETFFRGLEALRPTWYSTSPAFHQKILRQARERAAGARRGTLAGHGLRFVRSGSAVLPDEVARELEATLGVPVIEAYGMTEAPNISGNPVAAPRRGSVGRSAGPEIAILDEDGVPRPVGETGEIAVRGPSVMPGYEGDPATSAAAFRNGWFLTGDLGRLDGEGYLYLEGRKKELINRGGDKVSPLEIDRALAAHPSVDQAVAFSVPHPVLGEDLAAAVVLKTPGALGEADLRDALRRRLAAYKVPTRIFFLESLPIADTGKIRRSQLARELRDGFARRADPGDGTGVGGPPSTAAERLVAEVWKEVLNLPGIGLDEDCFALGATSLDVAQAAARLEDRLAESVHLPLLTAHRTVRSLAGRLEEVYGQALSRACGVSAPSAPSAPARPPERIDEAALARFRAWLRRRWERAGDDPVPSGKNPRAVFVLSAPRSGSTLLRVMLAGHPELFAPPELRLLHFRSLARWWRTHSGPHAFFREGLLRAWTAFSGESASLARKRLASRAGTDAGVAALYSEMQESIAPRILVDKTPLYAVDPSALERMEVWFEEPLYLHLTRHPAAVVDSYPRAHMDQLWIGEQPFAPRRLAELLWLESQHQVLHHLRRVPSVRSFRLDFESLVRDSEGTMRRLSEFLGVRFDRRLLCPYDGASSRMIDGAWPGSRMIGDPRFSSRRKIDAQAADAWAGRFDSSSLSELTLRQAAQLGYGAGPEPEPLEGLRRLTGIVHGWRGARARPDALAVGHHPGGSRRPLVWCLQSEAELIGLAAHLGPEQPLYGLRSAHHALVRTPENLRALAELYAREVRAVDPVGPYLVGGNCQGARIAFDIAHELIRGGAEVELLFLMEAWIERPYPGRVALLYGSESRRFNPYFSHPEPETSWRRDYGAFSVDILPGGHGQFFHSPNVEGLANTVRRHLDEVAARGGRARARL